MNERAPTLDFDLTAAAALVVHELNAAPAACVALAVRRGGAFRAGVGVAGSLTFDADAKEVRRETLFDLASLTKPIMAVALARLVREGRVALTAPLSQLVPAAAETSSARLRLELFLAHRAGLDAHCALYAPLASGVPQSREQMLRQAAGARRAECNEPPPEHGFPPVYSDLGYLLLGEAISTAAGLPLDEVVAREVNAHVGSYFGSSAAHHASPGESFAPTEVVAWRGGLVEGVVHDENAWAFSGRGTSGHAGLFGTVVDVLRFGTSVLDALKGRYPTWLSPADIEPLVRPRAQGTLRAGFDGRSGDAPRCGRFFGPNTFGHLGFTGTSIWIDPDVEMVGVLLTNRVHPTRARDAIHKARPLCYDRMVELSRSWALP